MADPVATACRELPTLRWIIETLQRVNESLFDGQLTQESSEVLDAAVKLADVYKKLIELASKPPATSPGKDRRNPADKVPF